MTAPDLSPYQKDHDFHVGNALGERNTWLVVALTAAMMVVEIVAGSLFNSLALRADGWHMGTHVMALGITAFAYYFARRHAHDSRFAFGTWKMEVLGGFASALLLLAVAAFMVWESGVRLLSPVPIEYNEALVVAVVGLAVNIASAFLLGHSHAEHGHGTGEPGQECHAGHSHAGHHDLNLRAAYVHVLADALTSVLAIAALLGGKYAGWNWLDPVMGLVGAFVIVLWSVGLLRETSRVLLDREMDHPVVGEIREALTADGQTHIADLHVWRVGRGKFACMVTVVAAQPQAVAAYHARLAMHEELAHVTIEVHSSP